MNSLEWWPKLDVETQAWLIAHNGEAVTQDVLGKITAAGGDPSLNTWWIGSHEPDDIHLSDEAIDWVEAVANGE